MPPLIKLKLFLVLIPLMLIGCENPRQPSDHTLMKDEYGQVFSNKMTGITGLLLSCDNMMDGCYLRLQNSKVVKWYIPEMEKLQ